MNRPLRILPALLVLSACTVTTNPDVPPEVTMGVVPVPVHVELRSGTCEIGPRTRVVVRTDMPGADLVARHLNQWLWRATGVASPDAAGEESSIVLMDAAGQGEDQDQDQGQGSESYLLEVSSGQVLIRASHAAGLFYGLQTLRQLLPPESERAAATHRSYEVPAVLVRDRPRFAWRGMHLDVGRHFFPPDQIHRFLDLLALHKFNVFHWHLTEDQGWRLQIRKWPKLTAVGAWRKESPRKGAPDEGDGKPYGGFYTQEQVRDIVAYARDRFITIVPEIEMPGHAQAAIAAYPQFGTTDKPVEVRTRWGISQSVFNVEDRTFAFLEDVLTEVLEMFPGEFIHIGGDECPKEQWNASEPARRRMLEEGLADAEELQSWFIRRIGDFLAKNGRRLIGWDEITQGGLSPGATVMVWRSWEHAVEAVRQGHDVVMSPTSHCYFDYYQGDPKTEPEAIGGFLPLEKVYAFEPVPPGLSREERKHVLGAQGNLWTEYIRSWDKLTYMAFPRACAMAEVTWSQAERKDYQAFLARLQKHLRRLEVLEVNYRPVAPQPGTAGD